MNLILLDVETTILLKQLMWRARCLKQLIWTLLIYFIIQKPKMFRKEFRLFCWGGDDTKALETPLPLDAGIPSYSDKIHYPEFQSITCFARKRCRVFVWRWESQQKRKTKTKRNVNWGTRITDHLLLMYLLTNKLVSETNYKELDRTLLIHEVSMEVATTLPDAG
jgi:hypothetical protein